jgi:hypothetical protein
MKAEGGSSGWFIGAQRSVAFLFLGCCFGIHI